MAKPRKFKKAGAPVPRWMLETRTDAWSEAGISDEIRLPHRGPAWPQLILFAVLITVTLVLFNNRQDLFPGHGPAIRIITALLLFIFGWGFASALGRTLTPAILRRMDPGTAGTVGFAIRLGTIIIVAVVALSIAGVKTSTLAVGGAFTAVVLGLASQQTLGNLFAGIVLQGTRPFRVGERVRLTGGGMAGSVEGTVSSLGLFYTSFITGSDRMMLPNSVLLQLAVIPLKAPDSIDLKVRFDSHVSPGRIQEKLSELITVPTLRPPAIYLEEVDRGDVVLRIQATPQNSHDGAQLADEILSATRDPSFTVSEPV